MEDFSFVFTVFFMLLGPVKLIPAFAGLTRGADVRFKRDAAIRGTVIAAVLCAFVALAGATLLGKYRMVLDFLVMYFTDRVMKTPGLGVALTVLGSVLVFVQVCLATETILKGLKGLGVFRA